MVIVFSAVRSALYTQRMHREDFSKVKPNKFLFSASACHKEVLSYVSLGSLFAQYLPSVSLYCRYFSRMDYYPGLLKGVSTVTFFVECECRISEKLYRATVFVEPPIFLRPNQTHARIIWKVGDPPAPRGGGGLGSAGPPAGLERSRTHTSSPSTGVGLFQNRAKHLVLLVACG